MSVGSGIPANAGCYRPITIAAPEGLCVNARSPAPVANRMAVGHRVVNTVMGAFAQALPDDGEFDIGDRTFTVAEVGTLTGDLGFNEVAPYAGIGWGNAVSKDGRWAFMVDVGVLFQGRPDVALASTGGTLSDDPLRTDELRREEANLEDDLGLFRFYPVISLGIAYRF